MRIEDEDLRSEFEESSDENLRVLEAGIIDLEAHPDHGEGLEAMLGAISRLHEKAVALELKNVVPLTRQIEYIFQTIAEGQQPFSSDLHDRLGHSFDAIRKLVAEAVTGEPSGVNSFYVLANLMGATGAQERVQSAEMESPEEGDDPKEETIVARQRFQNRKIAYIDDEELRYTFKVACEEHLQKLDNGLLHLEKHPGDRARIQELLREIHSIKGDAGMLGVEDIVPLAHEWEQQLIPANEGKIALSRELTERLYRGVDAIRQLTCEAVTGERAEIDLADELARLAGKRPQEEPESETHAETIVETAKELVVSQPSPMASLEPSEPPVSPPASSYRIDTIRVETQYLDRLMTQAGELIVAQTRMAHRLAQLQETIDIWEEWSRTAPTQSIAVSQRQDTAQSPQCALTLPRGTPSGLTRSGDWEQMRTQVERFKSAALEDVFRLGAVAGHLEEGIRTLRLLPLSTIFNQYRRMVRDLSQKLGKEVEFAISGGETRVDKRILENLKDPLMHILQNAIDHGIESPYERESQGKSPTARLGLRGYQTATNVVIEVMDDGRGIDLEKVKQKALDRGLYHADDLAAMTSEQIRDLIVLPGFSTSSFVTAVSGRGVGMDVVRTNVERLKGTIQIQSQPRQGCIFRLRFGIALATASVLLLAVDGITYALPLDCIETLLRIDDDCLFSLEGRSHMLWKERPIPVVSLGDLLEVSDRFRSPQPVVGKQPCIVIRVGQDRLGLLVDDLIDRQDVVLKSQSQLLKRVRNVSGATILGTGDVCAVLAPQDLIDSARARPCPIGHPGSIEPESSKPIILLIEDSIVTRTQEKRILESAGYEVVTAVDGLDGFEQLQNRHFDAVVSDIQMPNLDGLELTARIRQYPQYNELPIILVTSLATDADRKQGAKVGANAYITKNSFNFEILIETLRRLI